MTWYVKSLVAMICIAPFIVLVNFVSVKYSIPGEKSLFWWYLAVISGMLVWFVLLKGTTTVLIPSRHEIFPMMMIFLGGATLGTLGNVLLFQALTTHGINPGLPFAVFNTNSVAVYLIGVVLAMFLPEYFKDAFTWRGFAGVMLSVGGIYLMATK